MSPMMPKAKTADALVKELAPGFRAIVGRLRAFVKQRAPELDERVKWGGLCWIGRGVVCYAHAVADRVDFGFFKGAQLKDPDKILEGSGKFLRHVKVRKLSDLRERELAGMLKQAVAADEPE
jgi:hypothetical protein